VIEKISGIYRIVCVKNGRYYFGSAKNITKRWDIHKSRLRMESHDNPIIQRSWNKHGENSFRIELIECVNDENKLLEVEQKYLDKHVNKSNCMNIAKSATAPMMGRKHTDESKRKMVKSHPPHESPNYGNPLSPETKKKISEAKKGKPTTGDRFEAARKLGPWNKGKKVAHHYGEEKPGFKKDHIPWNKGIKWRRKKNRIEE